MNVRELIKELRKFDSNTAVAFFYHDSSYGALTESVEQLELERVDKQSWNSSAPDTFAVVVLR